MTTFVLLGVGYVIALAFVLAVLTAAKRGDEDMARQFSASRGPMETLPPAAPVRDSSRKPKAVAMAASQGGAGRTTSGLA
jgi:hypothetical protein